ncbi:MAG: peptide deformylase [Patescibacteria group bacterium]
MLKIVTAPHSILSQKAKSVAKIDKSIIALIAQMREALAAARDPVGVGLAATQIGKSLRIFIVKSTDKPQIQIFINPKITYISQEKSQQVHQSSKTKKAKAKSGISENKMLEGCLSLPTIWGEVQRQKELRLNYEDEKGKPHTRKFTGFIATIIQHEMDHLEGILFPKRVLEQKGKLYRSHKDEKGEDVFGEIEI